MQLRRESPRRCAADEVERNVDEHVLLPADHAAPAGLLRQGSGVEVIPCRRGLGMPQETGVNARISQGQRLAVDADRSLLQRADQVLGGVFKRVQIAAVRPTQPARRRDEASSGAVPAPAPAPRGCGPRC